MNGKISSRSPALLLIFVFLFSLIPVRPGNCAEQGKCGDALIRCLVAAGLTAVGNLPAGIGVGAWCFSGYIWCKQFYVE